MGFFTKDIKSLNDLFMHGLQDLYYAEKQIVKALPDMIEKATNAQLKRASRSILPRPKGRSQRLRQVFELLGARPEGRKMPRHRRHPEEGKE